MKFICPTCKSQRLEEVMTNVTVASQLTNISVTGDHEYGEQTNEAGEVSQYQCMQCGFIVCNDSGPITDTVELGRWVKDNCTKTSAYEKYTTLVFSTAHITVIDNALFQQPHDKVRIEQLEFGYRFNVPACETENEFMANLQAAGFSPEVRDIARIAYKEGASWVLFDCDGMVYEHLPKFDW